MPDTFRSTLLTQIRALEEKLAAARAALNAYDKHPSIDTKEPEVRPAGATSSRFTGMRPYDAIVRVLAENGGSMDRDDLMKALIEGGAVEGKKRGHHNLRISIDLNESLGKLLVDGTTVSLPDMQKPPNS